MKKRVYAVALMMVMLVAVGCSKKGSQGDDPKSIANTFWSSVQKGDSAKVKTVVTKSSLASLQGDEGGSVKEGSSFTLADAKIAGDTATVPTTLKDAEMSIEVQTILVKEDGAWKVDADKTMQAVFTAAMEQLSKGLGDAMKGAGQAMGEGLKAVGEGLKAAAPEIQEGVKAAVDGANQAIKAADQGMAQATVTAPVEAAGGAKSFNVGDAVQVEWKGKWWPAKIIALEGAGKWKVHYDNYDKTWDESVGAERIKTK